MMKNFEDKIKDEFLHKQFEFKDAYFDEVYEKIQIHQNKRSNKRGFLYFFFTGLVCSGLMFFFFSRENKNTDIVNPHSHALKTNNHLNQNKHQEERSILSVKEKQGAFMPKEAHLNTKIQKASKSPPNKKLNQSTEQAKKSGEAIQNVMTTTKGLSELKESVNTEPKKYTGKPKSNIEKEYGSVNNNTLANRANNINTGHWERGAQVVHAQRVMRIDNQNIQPLAVSFFTPEMALQEPLSFDAQKNPERTLDVYALLNTSMKFTDYNPSFSAQIKQKKTQEESAQLGSGGGILLSKTLHKRWSMSTGIEYQNLKEKIAYTPFTYTEHQMVDNSYYSVKDSVVWQDATVEINGVETLFANGYSRVIRDSTYIQNIDTLTTVLTNTELTKLNGTYSIKSVELPLLFSYALPMGVFTLQPTAGLALSYTKMNYRGHFLFDNQSQFNAPKTQAINANLWASVSVISSLTSKTSLFISPFYKHALRTTFYHTGSLNQKHHVYGFRAGIRIDL